MLDVGESMLYFLPMITPQPDLFDEPPIARRTDPVTSKTAAAGYSKTERPNDCQVMLQLIRDYPGLTAGEYGQLLLERGFKPMKAIRMPTKRISDLMHAGSIRAGDARKCEISGRNARTYYVNGGAR